jgi:hypothetical protein
LDVEDDCSSLMTVSSRDSVDTQTVGIDGATNGMQYSVVADRVLHTHTGFWSVHTTCAMLKLHCDRLAPSHSVEGLQSDGEHPPAGDPTKVPALELHIAQQVDADCDQPLG